MQNVGSLIAFAVLVMIAASSGALFMPGPWYASLNKPSWTPPDWLFPVAWTVLYAMIAIAGWLAWKSGGGICAPVVIWAFGLLLNGLWSYFMFGRHDIGLALVDVVALWFLTAAFIWTAWPIDWRASALFVPYFVWVTFAAVLNFAVWRMN